MLDLGEHGKVVRVDEYIPTVLERSQQIESLFQSERHVVRRFPKRHMHIYERSGIRRRVTHCPSDHLIFRRANSANPSHVFP
jgi:hypothetical protein